MLKRRPLLASVLSSLFIVAAIVGVSVQSGCETEASVAAARDRTSSEKASLDQNARKADEAIERMNAALAELEATKERLAETADETEAGTPARVEAERDLAKMAVRVEDLQKSLDEAAAAATEAKAKSAELEARLKRSDEAAAGARSGEPNAGSTIGGIIGMFIPGAAALAPVLGGAIYRGVRLSRAKAILEEDSKTKTTALDRVVASIDALAEAAPEVAAALTKNRALVDKIQTPVGKSAVDDAQAGTLRSPTTVS